MATPTYTPIETYTLGSATGNITFGSGNTLPQGYTDLVIVIQGTQESSYSARNMGIRFNGDSNSNYSSMQILSTSAGADTNLNNAYGPLFNSSTNTTSGVPTTAIINIANYSNNSMYKTILCRGGTAADHTSGGSNVGTYVGMNAATWRSNAPITEITLYAVAPNQAGSGANWSAGSTFTLYGIANAAIGAPKATGGIITYDSTYYYHTFGASGTFTPQQSLTADILVVAGGGGGGRIIGGGGGAGGLLGFASQSLSATGYTVTVGAGGAGATTSGFSGGATGSDSQFGALTLVKGGGGTAWVADGLTGGSGGGASGAGTGYTGGSATSGQGYAGGNSVSQSGGAGGGGAGAVGSNATSGGSGQNIGGNGGNGLSTYSSWGLVTGTGQNVSGTVYYAGGGGGGGSYANATTPTSGGLGGGGNGGLSNQSTASDIYAAVAGTPNTGGGGGGACNDFSGNNTTTYGKNGGSGVVIIRYLKA